MSAERRALAALTIARPAPARRLREALRECDGERLLAAAAEEGLEGLLFGNVQRLGLRDSLAPQIHARLADKYRRNAALNLKRIADLEHLAGHFAARGIDVFVLKGAALLHTLYSDPGLRPMTDIDVLVGETRRDDLRDLLTDEGYRQEPFYPDTFSNGVTIIDVHNHLLGAERIRARAQILAGGQQVLLHDHRVVQLGGGTVKTLGTAAEVLYQSLHFLKHNADRLLWLIEINELVDRLSDEEWSRARRLSEQTGQELPLHQTAFLARLLLGEGTAVHLERLAGEAGLGRLQRRVLARRAHEGALPVWAALLYFSPRRGFVPRSRSIFESLFPRPEIIRQIFQDTHTSLWRLYCRRAGQLFIRVLR